MRWAEHSGNQMRTKCWSRIVQKRDHRGNVGVERGWTILQESEHTDNIGIEGGKYYDGTLKIGQEGMSWVQFNSA
jgi:hypothetical protein